MPPNDDEPPSMVFAFTKVVIVGTNVMSRWHLRLETGRCQRILETDVATCHDPRGIFDCWGRFLHLLSVGINFSILKSVLLPMPPLA